MAEKIEMKVSVNPTQVGYVQHLFLLLAQHIDELPEEIQDCLYKMREEQEKCK